LGWAKTVLCFRQLGSLLGCFFEPFSLSEKPVCLLNQSVGPAFSSFACLRRCSALGRSRGDFGFMMSMSQVYGQITTAAVVTWRIIAISLPIRFGFVGARLLAEMPLERYADLNFAGVLRFAQDDPSKTCRALPCSPTFTKEKRMWSTCLSELSSRVRNCSQRPHPPPKNRRKGRAPGLHRKAAKT